MTGKTHIAVGAAASLAVAGSLGAPSLLVALLGGAIGGLLPDTDVASSTGSKELRHAWAALAVLFAALLMADHLLGSNLAASFVSSFSYQQLAGVAIVVAVCALGSASGHRGFSHSVVALVVTSLGVRLLYEPLCVPFAVGYASHLVLDLLNKRPERLLWPLRRGFCLRLCESGRLVDSALFVAGIAACGWLLLGDRWNIVPVTFIHL